MIDGGIIDVAILGLVFFVAGIAWMFKASRSGEGFENANEFTVAFVVACIGVCIVVGDLAYYIWDHITIGWI